MSLVVTLQGEVTFGLAGLETMEQAAAHFKAVELLPQRRWAGTPNERTEYCHCFW